MKKRNWLVVAALVTLFACGTHKSDTFENPSPYFLAIESARKAKPVDFARIGEIYEKDLAAFVGSRDSAAHLAIVRAIDEGRQEHRAHVQSQVVSKTLQKVVLHAFIESLRDPGAGKAGEREQEARKRELEGYYGCLSPTVVRRSEWIGRERELDESVRAGMARLGAGAGWEQAAAGIERTLKGVFALSILYELEGIEQARGQDSVKCEEKQAEAQLFLDAIRAYAKNDSLGDALAAHLGADYRELDIAQARLLTKQAFEAVLPEVE